MASVSDEAARFLRSLKVGDQVAHMPPGWHVRRACHVISVSVEASGAHRIVLRPDSGGVDSIVTVPPPLTPDEVAASYFKALS